jgi:peroxiredoxin
VCSLEVPDIEQGIASHYSDDEVVVLLANAGDPSGVIQSFLMNSGSALPSLMDQQQSVFRSYEPSISAYAPFPVQVVIDGDGVIRYLQYQYDAEGVRQVIDSILAE